MEEPSNPMPSAKAASISAGAMATDFSTPSTSVNHSRMNRMSRSSIARSTYSCCLSIGGLLSSSPQAPPTTAPRVQFPPAHGTAPRRARAVLPASCGSVVEAGQPARPGVGPVTEQAEQRRQHDSADDGGIEEHGDRQAHAELLHLHHRQRAEDGE